MPIASCVALAAAGGCSDPDTLTCEWLASADNCWSNTALMAATCLPSETASGTFSADNSTCNYPDGSGVVFTPALVLPLPDDPAWNFTVDGVNGACLHYEETAAGIKLTVGSQMVTNTFSGLGMTITCPDRSSVQTANAINLLGCPGSVGAVPGHFVGYSDTSVSFGIVGTADGNSLPVFACSKSVP